MTVDRLKRYDIMYIINPGRIPRGILRRIATPFNTGKGNGQGTGLGTYSSEKIVRENHGGYLEFTSQGHTTMVTIKLPHQELGNLAGSAAQTSAVVSKQDAAMLPKFWPEFYRDNPFFQEKTLPTWSELDQRYYRLAMTWSILDERYKMEMMGEHDNFHHIPPLVTDEDTEFIVATKQRPTLAFISLLRQDGKKINPNDKMKGYFSRTREIIRRIKEMQKELVVLPNEMIAVRKEMLEAAYQFEYWVYLVWTMRVGQYLEAEKVIKAEPSEMKYWHAKAQTMEQYDVIPDDVSTYLYENPSAKVLPTHASSAMTIEPPNGGIDLTPANMHLQTQNAGEGIQFHLDPAMLQQLKNAPGFMPVIINIKPLKDLKVFLGVQS